MRALQRTGDHNSTAIRAASRHAGTASGYLYFIASAAALGGLLFGFDIAVINGALVFLRRQFQLTDVQTEIAASSLLIGCVAGASLAGMLGDRFGRKRVLLLSAVLFLVSSLGAAVPRTVPEFLVARFLGGLAIGMESLLSPLYVAEISPPRLRGRLVGLNQLAIVSGILLAYLVSWLLAGLGEQSWRWMFASAIFPSVLFVWAFVRAPESPRWLIKEGRVEDARRVLERIGDGEVDAQVREIQAVIAEETGSLKELLEPGLRRPLVISVVLAVLQQVTGINTILFYGSVIFTEHMAAQSASSALLANVIVGTVNFVMTIVALAVVDRVGRKPLLLWASAGMAASLAILGFLFLYAPGAIAWILTFILLYVACFAVGLGPGVWIIISELFPTRIRGRAMSIATVSLWAACVLLTMTFLSLVRAISASGAFWIYALMCVTNFVFVWRATPETKGRTLEEIERWWKH